MPKHILKIISLLLLLTAAARATEYRRDEDVRIQGEVTDTLIAAGKTLTADFYSHEDIFLAGRTLDLRAQTTENLFAAGGKADLQNSLARLAVIAGGDLMFREARFHDLLTAGGNITLVNSTVDDDFIAAGGKILIDRDSQLLGGAAIAAGDLRLDGTVGKNAMLRGEEVVLNGAFLGDVDVRADHLQIGPGAVIGGSLAYRANQVRIDPAAKIAGGTRVLDPMTELAWPDSAFRALTAMLFTLGLLLPPALVALLLPQITARGRDEIKKNEAGAIGRGLVVLILIPPGLIVLFSTIIGIPLGLLLIALAAVFFCLSYGIGVFAAADRLRSYLFRRKSPLSRLEDRAAARFGWTLLVAVLLMILTGIPLLGFLAAFLVFLEGTGALYIQMKSGFRSPG